MTDRRRHQTVRAFRLPSTAAASWLLLAALLPSSVLSTGCTAPAPMVSETSQLNTDSALTTDRPNEILVLAVEDATGSVDTESLRREVAAALPARGYAPLSLATVDSVLANASLSVRGSVVDAEAVAPVRNVMQEDAVLGIKIRSWDTSLVPTEEARLRYEAEVLLVDSTTGQRLWWGPIAGEVKAGGADGVSPITTRDKLASIRKLVAGQILAQLPMRRP